MFSNRLFIQFAIALFGALAVLCACTSSSHTDVTPFAVATPALATFMPDTSMATMSQPMEKTVIAQDKARELAIRRVRESLDDRATEIEITAKVIALPEIADWIIVEVSIHDALPYRVVFVAVSADKSAWLVPLEFNAMVQHANLTITQKEQAWNMIELYVQLSRRGKMLILHQSSDIPFEKKYWTNPQQFADVVRPPQGQETEDGYQYDFYSWSELGGILEQWDCLVTHRGEVIVQAKKKVADLLGDAVITQ